MSAPRFGNSADRADSNKADVWVDPDTGELYVDMGDGDLLPISQTSVREMTFTETTGAGVYTATVPVAAGYSVLDMRVLSTALWTALTSATLDVGDADDADGYFDGVDLKNAPVVVAGDGYGLTLSGDGGAYTGGKYYEEAGTITATVTTVGATGNAGRTRILVTMVRGDRSVTAATKI